MRYSKLVFLMLCPALFLGLDLAAAAASPSFDCDRAKAEVEKMICNDDELAALDVTLATSFARALAHAPATSVSDLKASQKAWRQEMLKCSLRPDARQCTISAYNKRLGAL